MAKKCFNGNRKSSSFYNFEWTLVTEARVWKRAWTGKVDTSSRSRPSSAHGLCRRGHADVASLPLCCALRWRGVHPTIAPRCGASAKHIWKPQSSLVKFIKCWTGAGKQEEEWAVIPKSPISPFLAFGRRSHKNKTKQKLHSQPHLHEWFISARASPTIYVTEEKAVIQSMKKNCPYYPPNYI